MLTNESNHLALSDLGEIGDQDREQRANINEFGRLLPSLLESSSGRFVLFRQAKLVKSFGTKEAALRYGYANYGRETFLVQPVAPLPARVEDFHLAWGA